MHISDGVFIMSIGSEAPSRRRRCRGKKREETSRGSRRETAYRGAAVRGCVLQELDFNPLKSISTVEKRDPRRKKEKV